MRGEGEKEIQDVSVRPGKRVPLDKMSELGSSGKAYSEETDTGSKDNGERKRQSRKM